MEGALYERHRTHAALTAFKTLKVVREQRRITEVGANLKGMKGMIEENHSDFNHLRGRHSQPRAERLSQKRTE